MCFSCVSAVVQNIGKCASSSGKLFDSPRLLWPGFSPSGRFLLKSGRRKWRLERDGGMPASRVCSQVHHIFRIRIPGELLLSVVGCEPLPKVFSEFQQGKISFPGFIETEILVGLFDTS